MRAPTKTFEKEKLIHLEDVMHQREFVDFGTTVHMEKTRAVITQTVTCYGVTLTNLPTTHYLSFPLLLKRA